jgi:sugar phosphate isomerase/epimerase
MNSLKPAICTINWRNTKNFQEIVDIVSSMAFKGVEIWLPHVTTISMSRLKSVLEQRKLEPVCLSIPWGVKFWEHQEAILYYAEAIGVKGIKVFGDTDDRDSLTAKLNGFCNLAHDKRLDVYIENHRNQPHDTIENTLSIYNAVKSSNLKLIYDIYNSHELGEDMLEAFKRYQPFIHHLHVKWGKRDEKDRFVPLPLNEAPAEYKTILQKPGNKDLFASIEMVTDPEMLKKNIHFLAEEVA